MGRRTLAMKVMAEPARADPSPTPVPRLWPALSQTVQRQLAKQIAGLLQARLTAVDAATLHEGDHAEHADRHGGPDHNGAPCEARLHIRAPIDGRASPPASGGHPAGIPGGWLGGSFRVAAGSERSQRLRTPQSRNIQRWPI